MGCGKSKPSSGSVDKISPQHHPREDNSLTESSSCRGRDRSVSKERRLSTKVESGVEGESPSKVSKKEKKVKRKEGADTTTSDISYISNSVEDKKEMMDSKSSKSNKPRKSSVSEASTGGGDTEQAAQIISQALHRNVSTSKLKKQLSWRVWNELEMRDERELNKLKGFFDLLRKKLPVSIPTMVKSKSGFEKPVSFPDPSVNYSGLRLSLPMDMKQVLELIEYYRQGLTLHAYYFHMIYSEAKNIFINMEKSFNRISSAGGRVHVVGDLHGQLKDLLHIFHLANVPSETNRFVFNGDFVDRGPHGVEVAVILLSLFLCLPHSIALNRGNHEDRRVSKRYGFYDELMFKYGADAGNALYNGINDAFAWMPIGSIIDNQIIVMHGGIPTTEKGFDIARMDRCERGFHPQEAMINPHAAPSEDERFMMELLWNDPRDEPGAARSDRGQTCWFFGKDITENFLKRNKLKLVVRSHECVPDGFEFTQGGLSLTIFSASDYYEHNSNEGAVAIFTNGNAKPEIVAYKAPTIYEIGPLPGTKEIDYFAETEEAELNGIDQGLGAGGGMFRQMTMGGFMPQLSSVFSTFGNIPGVNMQEVQNKKIARLLIDSKPKLDAEFTKRDTAKTGILSRMDWADAMEVSVDLALPFHQLFTKLVPETARQVITNSSGVDEHFVKWQIFLNSYKMKSQDSMNTLSYDGTSNVDPISIGVADKLHKYQAEVEAMFSFFDSNNTGRIDLTEFRDGLEVLNQSLSDAMKMSGKDIDDLCKNLDVKKAGMIDASDFLHCLRLAEDNAIGFM